MSDRQDRKVESVVLAQFQYRHEAEFAAGFLDDAGIPYRLQVDDAGMGITMAVPATLWVRGMDLRKAREVLDLPDPSGSRRDAEDSLPVPAILGLDPDHDEAGLVARHEGGPDGSGSGRGGPGQGDGLPIVALDARNGAPGALRSEAIIRRDAAVVRGARQGGGARLTGFERVLAAVFLVGDVGALRVVLASENAAVWVGLLALVGLPLISAVLVGRTLRPVGELLKAISGSAQ